MSKTLIKDTSRSDPSRWWDIPCQTNEIRIFSFGGGVQSMAALVLQVQGRIKYDAFVFANVGEDSENPATLDYLHNHAIPFAQRHNIRFEIVQKNRRGGEADTVYKSVMRDNKSVPIPAVLASGAFGRRSCTEDFKIVPVNRWAKQQGYTHVINGVGISLDEFQRARYPLQYQPLRGVNIQRKLEYPLLDLRVTRHACVQLIVAAGLPIPPKSACFFCPFQSHGQWLNLRRENPDLFGAAVIVDERIREKRAGLGKDMWLHHAKVPLLQAVPLQPTLFDLDTSVSACDSGYCMT